MTGGIQLEANDSQSWALGSATSTPSRNLLSKSVCLRCYSTSLKQKCPEKDVVVCAYRPRVPCKSSKLSREGRKKGWMEGGREGASKGGKKRGKPVPEVCFHGGYKSRPVDTGDFTLHC